MRRLLVIAMAFATAGCSMFSAYDEQFAGPYRLVATDTMEDMVLCRSVGVEGDCAGDGLPDHTIFAAGASERYIVLARHPRTWPEAANRAISEYYYVIRTPDEARRGPDGNLRGPFTPEQFERERARLALPGFSRVFEELR